MKSASKDVFPNKATQNESFLEEGKVEENQSCSNTVSNNIPAALPVKRMSITLTGDVADYLEKWAKAEHLSVNELIRRAISTEIFLQKEIQIGSKLLIHRKDNEIREIIFR